MFNRMVPNKVPLESNDFGGGKKEVQKFHMILQKESYQNAGKIRSLPCIFYEIGFSLQVYTAFLLACQLLRIDNQQIKYYNLYHDPTETGTCFRPSA